MQFQIDTMSCGGCAKGITKAVQLADPRAEITIDLARQRVEVSSSRTAADIAAVLAKAGYPATALAAA